MANIRAMIIETSDKKLLGFMLLEKVIRGTTRGMHLCAADATRTTLVDVV